MTSNSTAHRPPPRALALFSGGLDSQLAVCLLRDQGVEVEGVAFTSPFFNAATAIKAAQYLDLHLHVKDFTDNILNLLEQPRYGFGAGLNPCIDCHIAMVRQAGAIMRERGLDFLVSGEVLNQRPKSQNRQALQIVANESGYDNLLLRPLSAQLLPPTAPEQNGLVDRTRLLGLEGRNRKPQMSLAEKFGLRFYPQPAGGCLLADRTYSLKLRELRDHEGLGNLSFINRLRIGRHFRLPPGERAYGLRLIIGRHHEDNLLIEKDICPGEFLIRPVAVPGASGILADGATPDETSLAAAICAHYSDYKPEQPAEMLIRSSDTDHKHLKVLPLSAAEIERFRILL